MPEILVSPADALPSQGGAHRAILESVFASIADSLLVLDTELRVADANDQVLRQLGRAKADVVGVPWAQLFPHLAETGRVADLRAVLAGGRPHRGRIPVVHAADGASHLFDVSTYPVRDPGTGRVTHLVEYAREITEEVKLQLQIMDAHGDLLRIKEQLEEKTTQVDAANSLLQEKCLSLEEANRRLERLAVLDVMTDLPNHRAFQEQLAYQVRQTQRHRRPFSLILFDVDDFKTYNDRYGHPEGDQLLSGIARLLKASVRAVDLPARYGGEEFAVILPETDRFGAAVVAERLRAAVAASSFPHKSVTVSVGVAEFPADAADGGGLVFCADKAMYHAKSSGKNTVSLWRGPGGNAPLPMHRSHEALQAAIRRCQAVPGLPAHLPGGSASGSRLLLVDQDELSLGTLRESLQACGYAVACASSGHEALETLAGAGGSFDLMLTDVALPDKSGFDLRAEARVLCPDLPLVFTSSYANPEVVQRVLDGGDSEFLIKPFHSDALVRLVEAVLTRRAQSRPMPDDAALRVL
ncbi:MAG: diguanylate cyclase [Armatimonadetes bacterium]|nr:diguanylate cyclase [Armatimonadota bacterium]